MSASIEIKGGKQMAAKLKRLDEKGIKLAMAALYQEGEGIMAVSKPRAPVGVDGTLRASGHVQLPKRTLNGVEVLLGYGGAAAGYAVFVHEGTGPAVGRPKYFPPIDALKRWAKKKLGDEDAAYGVAWKIYHKGTEPRKFLEEPFYAALAGMTGRIATKIRGGLR